MCEVGNMVRMKNLDMEMQKKQIHSNSTDFSRVWYTSKNDLSSQEPYKREESKKGQL